jgi:uncharacterized membrane protein
MPKDKLVVASFVLAAVGFIFIIVSFMNIKSTNYQYYTWIAFMLLIGSIVTRSISKRRMKQPKHEGP